MSNEAKLRHNALSAVCDDHFSLMRASENLRQREEQASTYIQSRWRSYNTRNNFERLKTAVLSIQAGYRGHLGRKRALCRSHLVASDSRLQHFQRAALILQRYWRGHFSRKKVHSFYDRRRYLQSVHSVGERLRENLYAQHGSLRHATWKGKDSHLRGAFATASCQSHHLTSTRSYASVESRYPDVVRAKVRGVEASTHY
mmetsp:Transcript_8301/g.34696  ORF Transcript_8301/g.34696 Transcript_8301/m.34696 type:complete len:200 (-) Transcript_8301:280-879(-)